MNPLQMALQIKHELQQVTWPGGSQEVVFGALGVYVFAGTPAEEQIPAGFPWCLVGIDGGDADDDDPEFITQGFTLLIGADVAGDPLGEFGIIGGAVGDLGQSAGRGVAEVAERVRAAVGKLTGADGAKVLLGLSRTGSPAPIGRSKHLVLHDQTLEALCTSALHYAAPQIAARSGTSFTWEGAHCSDRFDFLQYRVVEKVGSSPSTDPSDGTTVYTGTGAAATIDPVIGGRYYTVFADYNGRGGSTVEDSSEPEVGSYLVG